MFQIVESLEGQVGDDFHINPEEIESKYFGILTKVFNVARFASQFDVPDDLENLPNNLPNEDRWILSVFDAMMDDVQNFWKDMDIYNATQSIKGFATGVFQALVGNVQIETLRWRL